MMAYSTAWQTFVEAENNYFTQRHNYFQQPEELLLADLRQALATGGNSALSALRFLAFNEENRPQLEALLPTVVSYAIEGDIEFIRLAREVLLPHKEAPWFGEAIQPLLESYVASNDEWNYRRIAELYNQLGYDDLLTAFLTLCRKHIDPDIQEIPDSFE